MQPQRVRAPVFSLLALACFAACTGPGLEPPEGRGSGDGFGGGGTGFPSGGVGGSGGAGAPIGGMAGTGSPVVGGDSGGVSGTGGTGGTGGAGGSFGNAGNGSGFGGAGGVGGTAGDSSEPPFTDGGGLEPMAPVEDCETSRDRVELSGAADAGPAGCELALPEAALTQAENMLTVALSTESETLTPPRVLSELGCLFQGGNGFYVQLDAGGQPDRIVLCASSCEVAQMGATLELLYGCATPLP